ncbi:MAG TPA: (2Fe-2S)-binding protein [Solirubrobacterales bacterium]|nr:(2Fe-2S)-binding protein [Solirubrobacterales bacterium]
MNRRVKMIVNGRPFELEAEPRRLLADFLREDASLYGTHLGCEHGVCGACTVLVDGEPVRSCLMLAVQADGAEVETVEGLADDGNLHPLQQAFSDHHALQCGFCTPGFLLTALYLLRERPDLDDEAEIREALSGNLCRCTGYKNIVDAVRDAAGRMREIRATEEG